MSKRSDVKAELERLAQANGGLLIAQHVVRAAKEESNPLHSLFTWNDTKAAEQYRIQQAERLIRTVKIEIRPSVVTEHAVRIVRYAKNPMTERGYGETAVMLETTSRKPFLEAEYQRCLAQVRRFERILRAAEYHDTADELMTVMQQVHWRLEDEQVAAVAGT